ncbi:MAG TPA: hypothetical protein P5340_00095 [Defluviicoccus sp.]|nr:hypothetical protein [Defluviicoccus sp.]
MPSSVSHADQELDFGIPATLEDATAESATLENLRSGYTPLKWGSPREDAKKREGLGHIFDDQDASSKQYAGVNVLTLEHERTRRRLIQLIKRFEDEGVSFGCGEEVKCDAGSAEAASAFLRALPPEYGLPKIAPDGEGGVILAWEGAHRELVMSVCDWILYPVINPSSEAEHLSNVNFDGERIPDKILSYLPTN